MASYSFKVDSYSSPTAYIWKAEGSLTATKTYCGQLKTSAITVSCYNNQDLYIFLSTSSSSYSVSPQTMISLVMGSTFPGTYDIVDTASPPYIHLKAPTGYAQHTATVSVETRYTLSFSILGTTVSSMRVHAYPASMPIPTLSGHKFLGWYTNATYSPMYLVTPGVVLSANKTVYGTWTRENVVVYRGNTGVNYNSNIVRKTLFEQGVLGTPNLSKGSSTSVQCSLNTENYRPVRVEYIIDGTYTGSGTTITTYYTIDVVSIAGEGTHTVKVKLVDYQYQFYLDSGYSTFTDSFYNTTQLSTPSIGISSGGEIYWSAISHADYYIIEYSSSSSGSFTYLDDTTSTSYSPSSSYQGYWFRVQACSSDPHYTSSNYSNYAQYPLPTPTIHLTLEYYVWSHGQTDIGSYDITVYDGYGNYLNSFGYGDNQISFDVDLSHGNYIVVEGPNQYDGSLECTVNVWGGSAGDQYETQPGDGPVQLSYSLTSADDNVTLNVDYYCEPA